MRTTPRWIPGGVPLAVSPRGLVALREDLGLLESMWQETEAGQGLEEVLQVLVRAHGNDVFTLPDFLAVSVEEDAVRVVGRGAFQVRVVADGGEQVFSAPRVVVWDEACFTGVRDLTVVLESADVGTTPGLPLRSGLVEASTLTWQEPGTGPVPADRGAGEPVPDPVTPVPDPAPGPGAPVESPVAAPAVVVGPGVAAESAVVGGPAVVAEPAVVGVAGVLGGPAVLGVPAPPSPGGTPLDPAPAEPAGHVPATWPASPVPAPVPAEPASPDPAPAGDAGATLRPEDVDPYAGPRWAQGAQETAVPGPEDQVGNLGAPEVLGTPEVSDALEVPGMSEAPEVPHTPGAPEVSGVPGTPGMSRAGLEGPGDQPGSGAPSPAPDPAQSAPPVPAAPPAPIPAAPPVPAAPPAPARPPQDPGPASVEQVEEDYFGHLFDATSLTPHRVEDAAIRQVHCDDVSPLDAVSARHQPQGDPQAPGTGQGTGQVPDPPGGASGELPGGLPDPPGGTLAAGDGWRHDGRTVSSAQLRAECQAALPQGGDAAALPGPAGGTGLSGGAPGELLGQAPGPAGGLPGGPPGGLPDPPAGLPGGALAAGGDWRHDGCTVSSAQLRAEHQALGTGLPLPPGTVPDGSAPMVLAAFCPANHPNPVHASRCRQCGAEVTSATGMVRRPPLGLLRASTGATAVLDADVVVGRRPQVTTRSGGPTPHLIAVASPDLGISKSHCAIRVEGWDLTVEDLRSRNGTVLLRPGEAPHRVPEHGSTFLRTGDVIDLGENVTLTIEEAR